MGFGFLETRRPDVVFVGLALCAMGLVLFAYGLVQLRMAYRLDGPAEIASGTVDRLWGNYRVAYSFVVDNQTVTVGRTTIPPQNWNALRVGDSMPVRYLRDDLTINEPNLPGERSLIITKDG